MKRFIPIYSLLIFAMLLASCSTGRRAHNAHRRGHAERREQTVDVKNLPKERRLLVEEANTWLGTPYLYAHAEKGFGTDCSGMVMSVYLQALEIKLPRNSRKQAEFCKTIPREKAVAGDLVFFATGKDPSRISHVGMLVDKEQFIHASSSKGVVVSKLDSPYYSKRIICFGRVPALERMTAVLLLMETMPEMM